MIPRLPTSKKWTTLPLEFAQKVRGVFAQNFKAEAEVGEFHVEGRIYASEVLVRIGYLENGRLRQMNFEASADFSAEAVNAVEKIYLCVDAIASLMEEAFQKQALEEDFDFPLHWRPYDFENSKVYLQYSTINTQLEAEADRLLGLLDEALVQEEQSSEDALAQAVIDTELAKEIQKRIRAGFDLN
jgi:hypothetical protein